MRTGQVEQEAPGGRGSDHVHDDRQGFVLAAVVARQDDLPQKARGLVLVPGRAQQAQHSGAALRVLVGAGGPDIYQPRRELLDPFVRAPGVPVELRRHPGDGPADVSARHDRQRSRPRPHHEGGATIGALDAHPLVAGRFVHPLLVRRCAIERAARQQLVGQQLDLTERRLMAVGPHPAIQPFAAVVHVAHLPVAVIFLVPTPFAGRVGVRRDAVLLDVNEGRVQLAPGAFRGARQNAGHGGIDVLQHGKGQTRLAVLVIEQPDQFVGRVPGAAPLGQPLRKQVDLRGVVRGLPRRVGVTGAKTQIEHERQAMTFSYRPDFVRTVGIERRERQFRRFSGGHVDGALAVAVADDQLAAGARGRQRDRQGGNHAVGLLGVAVGREETARFVDQQLVEWRVEPVEGATEARRHQSEDSAESLRPCGTRQPHPLGFDLPAVANRPVDEGLRSLAVGRALGPLDQCPNLRLGNGKRQGARALHLQPRHGRQQPAVDAEVARPVDGQQQLLDRGLDAALIHGVLLRLADRTTECPSHWAPVRGAA